MVMMTVILPMSIGDVVVLNSGGPSMEVTDLPDVHCAECSYEDSAYGDRLIHRSLFSRSALRVTRRRVVH